MSEPILIQPCQSYGSLSRNSSILDGEDSRARQIQTPTRVQECSYDDTPSWHPKRSQGQSGEGVGIVPVADRPFSGARRIPPELQCLMFIIRPMSQLKSPSRCSCPIASGSTPRTSKSSSSILTQVQSYLLTTSSAQTKCFLPKHSSNPGQPSHSDLVRFSYVTLLLLFYLGYLIQLTTMH